MVNPYYQDDWLTVYQGDCRTAMAAMEPESVHCVVTSPPYWGLRDYGDSGQLGLESTPEEYVAAMVDVFREVRRVLRSDGTVWLNLGDSYATGGGSVGRAPGGGDQGERFIRAGMINTQPNRMPIPGLKPKDLVGIPWRVAFALQADGWYLRSDIIWAKPNPMPESVTDRPTKSHEYLFLLSKSARYYFDQLAVREPHMSIEKYGVSGDADWRDNLKSRTNGAKMSEPSKTMARGNLVSRDPDYVGHADGRNIRTVWTIATQPYPGAHFATFPRKLVEPCVKAGCPESGVVLDPFAGSGTTGLVAQSLGRRAILIDLSADYLVQVMTRNRDIPLGLGG